MAEYRLIQDGQPVASVDGPDDDALREIHHYATVYSLDGPVHIQRREPNEWRTLATIQRREPSG